MQAERLEPRAMLAVTPTFEFSSYALTGPTNGESVARSW
jgi:hypothetical protein